jgi:hypothetical protein
MRIPQSVNICGQKFTIIRLKQIIIDGKYCLGACSADECKILIKSGLHKEKAREVLLHECIHAISDNLNINLTENKVNTLSIEILRLIRSNGLDFLL